MDKFGIKLPKTAKSDEVISKSEEEELDELIDASKQIPEKIKSTVDEYFGKDDKSKTKVEEKSFFKKFDDWFDEKVASWTKK